MTYRPIAVLQSQLTFPAEARVPLSTLWRPMEGVHPAANASGPVVTNNAITQSAPSTAGMVFVPWNAIDGNGRSKFNKQGQAWGQVHASLSPNAGPTSQVSCWNIPTDRTHFMAPSALVMPGVMDVNFNTNSKRVILQGEHSGGLTFSNVVDFDVLIEHEGRMSALISKPEQVTLGGNGLTYKDITMIENRTIREWRFSLPISMYFQGIWVEEGSVVFAAANKPLIVLDGDSWGDSFNNTWQSGAGTTDDLGSFQTFGAVAGFIRATGAKVAQMFEGGTSWFNANNGAQTARNTYYSVGGYGQHSVFLSTFRNAVYNARFKPQFPVMYMIEGSANDGTLGGTPYRTTMTTRVLAGLDELIAYDPGLPIVLATPQSYTDPTPAGGSTTDLNRLGIFDAAVLRAGAGSAGVGVVGFIDQMDYTDGTGSNGSPSTSQWAAIVGPDGLHLNRAGARYIGQRWADELGKCQVPVTRLAACLAA